MFGLDRDGHAPVQPEQPPPNEGMQVTIRLKRNVAVRLDDNSNRISFEANTSLENVLKALDLDEEDLQHEDELPDGFPGEHCWYDDTPEGERSAQEDDELEDLEDNLSGKSIPELREFARDHNIDLGDARKKRDILKVLRDSDAVN